MATAIASSHCRIRVQSPKLTMSATPPIVQKLVRLHDGAEGKGQRKGRVRTTSEARQISGRHGLGNWYRQELARTDKVAVKSSPRPPCVG